MDVTPIPARPAPLRAIAAFDACVDRCATKVRTPALDRVFFPLSSAADHSLLWIAAGALRSARDGNPAAARNLGAAMAIESFTTNVVVKSAFRRVRPPRPVDGPLPYGMHTPITSSFPSGHATAAFCAAAMLGHGRRSAPAWYALAAAVAASRVYVRLHHASDVLAGAALGYGLGVTLRHLLPLAGGDRPGNAAGASRGWAARRLSPDPEAR